MKVITALLLSLSIIFSSNAQSIFKDVIAPKIEITSWVNNPDELIAIEGKHVVLEFWSTWCAPCIAAIPHLNQLTEKYRNEIVFISVNSYETRTRVERFLSKKQFESYVALDENGKLRKDFNVQSIPVTIIVDKDGMLRWRGIATKLTEAILDTFLSENKFKETESKEVILDKKISISIPRIIDYQLRVDQGDATLGKAITTDFENGFYLKLSNYSIYSVFPSFSYLFGSGEDWRFKGKQPKDDIINVEIQSNIILNEDNVKGRIILDNVILKMGELYNFTVIPSEEIQEIWYIEPNNSRLKNYISEKQNLDVEEVEKTEKFIKYKNIFFDYLASFISIRTKANTQYNSTERPVRYDLTIPNTNDILEMSKYLKEKYEINLVKKKVKVNVKTVMFN